MDQARSGQGPGAESRVRQASERMKGGLVAVDLSGWASDSWRRVTWRCRVSRPALT